MTVSTIYILKLIDLPCDHRQFIFDQNEFILLFNNLSEEIHYVDFEICSAMDKTLMRRSNFLCKLIIGLDIRAMISHCNSPIISVNATPSPKLARVSDVQTYSLKANIRKITYW